MLHDMAWLQCKTAAAQCGSKARRHLHSEAFRTQTFIHTHGRCQQFVSLRRHAQKTMDKRLATIGACPRICGLFRDGSGFLDFGVFHGMDKWLCSGTLCCWRRRPKTAGARKNWRWGWITGRSFVGRTRPTPDFISLWRGAMQERWRLARGSSSSSTARPQSTARRSTASVRTSDRWPSCKKPSGPIFGKIIKNMEEIQKMAGKTGARSAPLCWWGNFLYFFHIFYNFSKKLALTFFYRRWPTASWTTTPSEETGTLGTEARTPSSSKRFLRALRRQCWRSRILLLIFVLLSVLSLQDLYYHDY